MNEQDTRFNKIDPLLHAAGWRGTVPGAKALNEYTFTDGRLLGMGQRAKRERADYVLEYMGRKLAVIEAKSDDKGVTEGLPQAKLYAQMLQLRIAYATNGDGLYKVDMQTAQEGDVVPFKFPTPQELAEMVNLAPTPMQARFDSMAWAKKANWGLRYYQELAANAVLDAIGEGKRDRLLLNLATGTGKTSIAAQIAWKLHQAKWTRSGNGGRPPRILFLADRNILANQAYSDFLSFNAFEENSLLRITTKAIHKDGKPPMNGAVFFTIFQTFMTGETEDAPGKFVFGEYPKDYFDLIIIDECHRGGANDEGTWRGIMEYFSPAVQLGLTATPKRKENSDTYAYFGEPLYTYSLKQGINDGFLTPFKVIQVETSLTSVTIDGDDKVIKGEPIAGKVYGVKEFGKDIMSPERDEFMVKWLMKNINMDQKTIVFCGTQDHAAQVRDLITKHKGSQHVDYCVRVSADDKDIGDAHLKQFQDNEKSLPTILTTSHKLSTGVDAKNVRNIVLMRPPQNIIEFKQIVGRGTRVFDGKDFFTIVDFVGAHELFNDPAWDGTPVEPPAPTPPTGGGDPVDGEPGKGTKRPERIVVHFGPGKMRDVQCKSETLFIDAEGRPIRTEEFLKGLFEILPDFFKDEDELRKIWSQPDTRKSLLAGLADRGFPIEHLHRLQSAIEANECDLFDVLSFIRFASPRATRAMRSEWAKKAISSDFNVRQRAFLDFVLEQYVKVGFEELDQDKLPDLLRLRYGDSLMDAMKDLGGNPDDIGNMFKGFQRHLYLQAS